MSAEAGVKRNPTEPGMQRRRDMLDNRFQVAEMDDQAPITAEFFRNLRAAADPQHGRPVIRDSINEIWELHAPRGMPADRKADYVREIVPRAFAATLLPKRPDFLQSVRWPEEFERLEDKKTHFDFMLNTLLPISSSVSHRAEVFDFLMKIYGFKNDVIALELGSGANYIGKHLAERWPYPPTDVMERIPKGTNGQRLRKNPYLTEVIRSIVEAPIDFRRILGIDIYDPDDPFIKNWRLACSLTYEERLIAEKVAHYETLEATHHENVEWQWGDIIDYTPEEYQKDYPGEPLPLFTFASFVLYLLTERKQQQGLRNLADFAIKSGGVAAVMDDIEAISKDHVPTITRRQRNFGSTGLWIFDGRRPKDGWLKHMSIKSGRIGGIILEPALLAMLNPQDPTNIKLTQRAPRQLRPPRKRIYVAAVKA